MTTKSDFTRALTWITDIFDRLDIPYQVVGGLAAKCYGSTRPLHDIDFYVPGKDISKLEKELAVHIEFGPEHYRDEYWDLVFMKLSYQGHQIEIGDANHTWYFDSQSRKWIKEQINFSESNTIEFEGIGLCVMPKENLIKYKQRLGRKVDRTDLKEIQNLA